MVEVGRDGGSARGNSSAYGSANGRVGGSASGRDDGGIGGGGMDGVRDEECYDGGDESSNGGARDACDRNGDSDDEVEILGCSRQGKEPIVEEP